VEVIGIARHYLYYELSKCNGVLVMVYATMIASWVFSNLTLI